MLDAAAAQFAHHGYHGTTIRDIAVGAGMTPGAVYFHFASKHALLLEVYEEGVRRVLSRLDQIAAPEAAAWQQLEKMAIAHLQAILDQSDYARVVIRVFPDDVKEVSDELKSQRNLYEKRFRAVIDEIPRLSPRERKFARLLLLGGLNWTPSWYRPDQDGVDAIARVFTRLLRRDNDQRET
ncbi:MAG: TetR/AcrR family transcriptional regulator [Nevskiales bacterium]